MKQAWLDSRVIKMVWRRLGDSAGRVFNCNGDMCNWCKDRKDPGPTVFEFEGESRTICWHHESRVPVFDEDSLRVIQQYAVLHEAQAA